MGEDMLPAHGFDQLLRFAAPCGSLLQHLLRIQFARFIGKFPKSCQQTAVIPLPHRQLPLAAQQEDRLLLRPPFLLLFRNFLVFLNDLFQITPLLILEIIALAIVIWAVSYVAITLPYRHSELINEKSIFETSSLQEQYINALQFYPFRIQTNKSAEEGFMPAPTTETQAAADAPAESQEATATTNGVPGPQLAETTVPEISATSG